MIWALVWVSGQSGFAAVLCQINEDVGRGRKGKRRKGEGRKKRPAKCPLFPSVTFVSNPATLAQLRREGNERQQNSNSTTTKKKYKLKKTPIRSKIVLLVNRKLRHIPTTPPNHPKRPSRNQRSIFKPN